MSKQKDESKVQISIKIEKKKLEEIDAIAKKANLTRSQLMENMVNVGLEEAKAMDKYGLIAIYLAGQKAAMKLKEAFYKGQLDFMKEETVK